MFSKRLAPLLTLACGVCILWLLFSGGAQKLMQLVFSPTASSLPTGVTTETIGDTTTDATTQEPITEFATGLDVPWELVFLPSGDALVTERSGRVLRIGKNEKIYPIAGVKAAGEGGLLGMALDPDFDTNQFIYFYLTGETDTGIENRVERYQLVADALENRTVILAGIKASKNHDGGRIAFGPDNFLYVTTGDAQEEDLAQQTDSLSGKILRVASDGAIPDGSAFPNGVYSFGHRNVQGLAWDSSGQLWATEHGRSGAGMTGYDELNRIQPGANYGWPEIEGSETSLESVAPVQFSSSTETWAPAGMAYWDGSLFFTGLRGESLYEYSIANNTIKSHFHEEFGRLRTVVVGPDGRMYLLTSNTDGRGTAGEKDDQIISIDPQVFRL